MYLTIVIWSNLKVEESQGLKSTIHYRRIYENKGTCQIVYLTIVLWSNLKVEGLQSLKSTTHYSRLYENKGTSEIVYLTIVLWSNLKEEGLQSWESRTHYRRLYETKKFILQIISNIHETVSRQMNIKNLYMNYFHLEI